MSKWGRDKERVFKAFKIMNWERPRIAVTAKSLENKEIECRAVSLSYNEHYFLSGRREKLGQSKMPHQVSTEASNKNIENQLIRLILQASQAST